jgi:phage-related protein
MIYNRKNSDVVLLSSAKLFQNVPNPFGQTTMTKNYIPENAGTATIQVANMNGFIMKSINVSSKGNGQLTLSTSQLAAGTFVYSLTVDGVLIDTKKMLFV